MNKNIFNKLSKKVFVGIVPIIFVGIFLCAKPVVKNIFVESSKYKTPANKSFIDMNFYKCVIDSYNSANYYSSTYELKTLLTYDDSITDEQLSEIKYLECNVPWKITDNQGNIIMKSFRVDENGNNITDENIITMGLDIKDFTGIEKMPNLKRFGSSYDTSSSIDLSHNTMLEEITITNNPNINEINLSDNSNLENVIIRNNSNLTIINLGDIGIENLNIESNNSLSSIDLNNNILRATINYNKNLTNIDFGENSQLTFLNVTGNKLKNIDLSNCSNLTDYTNSGQQETFYLNRHTVNSMTFDDVLTMLLQNEEYSSSPRDLLDGKINNLTLSTTDDFYALMSNGEREYYNFNYNIIPQYIEVTNYNTYHNEINYDDGYIYIKNLRGSSDVDSLISDYMISKNVSVNLDSNKMIVRYNDDLVDEFNILSFKSDKYDLSYPYIFGEYDDIVDNIDLINLTLDFDSQNNRFLIKNGNTIMDQFDHSWVTSEKYDLSNESISVQEDNIEDFLSNINCINCTPVIITDNNHLETTSDDFKSGDLLEIRKEHDNSYTKLKRYSLTFSVSRVALNMSSIDMNLVSKKTYQLNTVVIPYYSDNQNVTWESSDESVATVDENGLVTAVGVGEAIITVTTEDGGHTDTCSVTVNGVDMHRLTYRDGDWTYSHDYEEGSTVELKSDYIKQGYIFKGWKDSNNQEYTDKFTMPDHDVELTAILELAKPAIQNDDYNLVNDDSNDIGVLTGINLGTDVEDLDLRISSIYDYHVYNNKGVEKTSGNLGTGDKIKFYLNTDNDVFVTEYIVSIKGDVNGDGEFKIGDIVKLYNYMYDGFPGYCYKKAADYNNDGKNLVGDIVKMYNALFTGQ